MVEAQAEDRCGGKLVNLFTLTASYHRKGRVQPVPVGEVAEEVSLWRQPTSLDMAKSTSMGETHKVMEEEDQAEELEFMLISKITLVVNSAPLAAASLTIPITLEQLVRFTSTKVVAVRNTVNSSTTLMRT